MKMKSKTSNVFRFIMLTLFLLFIGLYITQAFGYYEFTNNKKNALTEQNIKKFEKDIKEGRNIKATNYLQEDKNYNNLLSNASLKLSKDISFLFNAFMSNLFNEINKLTSTN